MTPRSCLRWKPTGKIFNIVGLRWVPTGKIFTSSTTKVDSEPTNGLNGQITRTSMNANKLLMSVQLVPKVVPPADKTATSRQELELLFHHHITMLSSVGPLSKIVSNRDIYSAGFHLNDKVKDICDSALDDIVAFLIPVAKMKSIRSVVCKLVFSAACYFLWQERNYRIFKKKKRSYALSWKPCQGDSLNLPDHRYIKMEMVMPHPLESNSLPHAHAQTTKTYYKHQDSRIMKAQELKTKTSAQTLIYKIFLQRYQVYQGRLLASFQDDAKYEHVGQDTRSQGGKDDQDGRIKI
ncbi:hypothetical protein Tco_1182062 [Tanacetum coccineum]